MNRDRLYPQVLKLLETFEVVLRQQPPNRTVLNQFREELVRDVTSLRIAASPLAYTANATQLGANNPVLATLSPEERWIIENTYRPTTLPLDPHVPSIRDVPDERVRAGCEAVEERLGKIQQLLAAKNLDVKAIENQLRQIEESLAAIPNGR